MSKPMERCRDCKFWAKHDHDHLGECSRWLRGYGIELDQVPANEVHVENDEGWGAEMGPDFGCVLWEAKS